MRNTITRGWLLALALLALGACKGSDSETAKDAKAADDAGRKKQALKNTEPGPHELAGQKQETGDSKVCKDLPG